MTGEGGAREGERVKEDVKGGMWCTFFLGALGSLARALPAVRSSPARTAGHNAAVMPNCFSCRFQTHRLTPLRVLVVFFNHQPHPRTTATHSNTHLPSM